jgi:N-glycosylase/DNA lyase
VKWTEWKPLKLAPKFNRVSLAETLDGGQTFRWVQDPLDIWTGQWSDVIVRIQFSDEGRLTWSAPSALEAGDVEDRIRIYFGADVDWDSLIDHLPWRSDPHLKKAIKAFSGLRILRQPLEETLLAFLCSATKRIVQIKQMCELLAQKIGSEIIPGVTQLPTFEEIAKSEPVALNRCKLGFRGKYIMRSAQFLAERPGWLEETEALPYATAKERMMLLPGVGEKVADCVLLFGAGKIEAFPVDTWISQTLMKRYELSGWNNQQLTDFGRLHFGSAAGLAQQFLFSWERHFGKR